MAATNVQTGTIDPRWARVRPLVSRTIIGAVVAAGLVGIVAVLLGDFGRVAVQLLLTVVVVVVFALLSWYDAGVSSRRSGTFAFASIVVSLYRLVAGLVAKITVGVIALLALLLSVPLLAPDVDLASGYWRLVWVVVILDLLGTVVVPLSNALSGPRDQGATGPGGSHGPSADAWSLQPATRRPVASGTTEAVDGWSGTPEPAVLAAATSADHATPTTVADPVAVAPSVVAAPSAVVAWAPRDGAVTVTGSDGLLYERRPESARAFAWPRSVDGTSRPAAPDGSPDFSGVARP